MPNLLSLSRTNRTILGAVAVLLIASSIALYYVHSVRAAVTYSLVMDVYMWDVFTCTGGYTTGTPFGTCDAAHVGQGWTSGMCLGSFSCWNGDINNCGNFQHTEFTCVASGSCTPDASCAATTMDGDTCTDSCGNVYAGTATCNNGSRGPYPACPVGPVCSEAATESCSFSNSCGMINTGWVLCDGSCSVGSPAESLCTSTYTEGAYYAESSYYAQGSYGPSCSGGSVTLTAAPSRVRSGQTATLTLTGSGINTSCVVSGPGVNTTVTASACTASRTITTPAIAAQSVYTVSCDSGAVTGKAIINVVPNVSEF